MNSTRIARSCATTQLFALTAVLAAGTVSAEEAAGDWSGLLAGQLHVIVHVMKDPSGHYGATLESPDQGKFVLPADKVAAEANRFSFSIPKIGGSFTGIWNPEKNGWVGTWPQGATLPFVLSRMTSRAAALAPTIRPQEDAMAAGPHPYREEVVSIANAAAEFVVLMAAPGMRLGQLLPLQNAKIAKASGSSNADIAGRLAFYDKFYVDQVIAKGGGQALAIAKADIAKAVTDKIIPAASADMVATMITSPWAREAFAYDTIPALRQLNTPVLALNGSLDLQEPGNENLNPIRAALQGNARATIVELPGLNHLFQTAKLGAPTEYGWIEGQSLRQHLR